MALPPPVEVWAALYAYTTQALGARLVSAAIANVKSC